MPDWDKFVTWERLEDALGGIRESLEKSSSDAAAALASARGNRPPVHVVERHSQTVGRRLLLARRSERLTFLVRQTKGKRSKLFFAVVFSS